MKKLEKFIVEVYVEDNMFISEVEPKVTEEISKGNYNYIGLYIDPNEE